MAHIKAETGTQATGLGCLYEHPSDSLADAVFWRQSSMVLTTQFDENIFFSSHVTVIKMTLGTHYMI